MTTAPPPAHYRAVEGALASGFATAELHHLWGHDQRATSTFAGEMSLKRKMSSPFLCRQPLLMSSFRKQQPQAASCLTTLS
ncbi:hypothetical protein CN229_16065 [Sinorhizobium meliloti]|nr:hypothetical protein CN229_16065 [Sinorhizobium meliloti]